MISSTKPFRLAQLLRAAVEQGAHLAGHILCQQDGRRDGHKKDADQCRRDPHHHNEGTAHGDDAGGDLEQVGGQGRVDRVNVVGDAADDVAGLVVVEVFDRENAQFLEYVLPHPEHDLLAEMDHQHRQNVGQQGRKGIEQQHQAAVVKYPWEVNAARLGSDGVNGVAGKGRPDEGKHVAGYGQQQSRQQHQLVAEQVSAQPQQNFFRFLGFQQGLLEH